LSPLDFISPNNFRHNSNRGQMSFAQNKSRKSKTLYECGNETCTNVGRRYKKCGKCNVQRYCSKKCQQAHWKKHLPLCKTFCCSNKSDELLKDELLQWSKIIKYAIGRSDIATLSALSTSKGDNRGVFCIDFNRTNTFGRLYFNFSLDDWQKKLEVSTGAVEIIQKQKRNETVCGILRENRILHVLKVVLRPIDL